ncbi:MAG: CARDB domain-containing protein, partial [Candidatus Thalassarchaeaceae archaeon]|nr:CARDB domain-containing protein [Candidatus Thalassarchaeaceae archaeon]
MVASAVAPPRRSALFIVLIFLLSTQLVLFQAPEPLDDVESSLHVMGVRNSQGTVDVPEWAVGDVWTFDSFFDVQDLIASGAPGSNVGILRGTLTKEVVDTTIMMIENQSTIVYVVESSGTFQKNGISIVTDQATVTGDLRVEYESDELVRASDLGQITYDMDLDVDLRNIPFPISIITGSTLDLADISIGTQYSPPKEYYDFPMAVGEYWDTSVTMSTTWSGSVYQNLFELPADSEDQSTESHGVTSVGNPGVGYSGCASSLNATSFNSTGSVTGFRWYCPSAKGEAWWHQELDLGLQIDFKLLTYTPAIRDPTISVETVFPAWPLNSNMGAWVNLTDPSTGSPLGNQGVQFRYESTGDYRALTTATNGSAYVEFDTGAWQDPSPTTYDYASHGVIGWDAAAKSVGVSTMVLDENLVEVDLVALASGVSVSRTRDGVTEQLNSITGFNSVPGDLLEFSIPVRNEGILSAPSTELEITSPDGSTSRANIPNLPARSEVRVDVQWTVPEGQAIGNSLLQFEVDPDLLVTADANRSNNADVFNIFVG